MRETIIKQKLEAVFFKTDAGAEPVREWLKEQSLQDKKNIGEDILTVQYGWPLGMPLVKNMGQGLWEIRSNLPTNKIARIIFFMDMGVMILVHGFIKKTQKTTPGDITLAQQRKRQYEVKHDR